LDRSKGFSIDPKHCVLVKKDKKKPLKSVGLAVNAIDLFSNQIIEFLAHLVDKMP